MRDVAMTRVTGFLVGDYYSVEGTDRGLLGLDYEKKYPGGIHLFPPHGKILQLSGDAMPGANLEEKNHFLGMATTLYEELTEKNLRDIRMAITLLWEGFEDMVLEDLGREASPNSYDDWAALTEISFKNERMERELTPWRPDMNLEDYYRETENVKGTGIIAVARIRQRE
jgi:hypothetical protein